MVIIIKRILMILMCIALVISTGCWDQKIYERIGFILQVGFELDEEERIIFTVSIPVISLEIDDDIEIISVTADIIREGRELTRHQSGKSVEGGKIQHLYFSKEIAKKGIFDILEIFIRSPENPLLANIIVIDGSPLDLMETSKKYKDKPRPAFYMNDLLEGARRSGYTTETRVYNFSTMVYSNTIDPTASLVRYDDKKMEIAGTALFNGDKMVGEIDPVQTGLLFALMGGKTNSEYIYRGDDLNKEQRDFKKGVALLVSNSKRKVKIDTSGTTPMISISLELSASLDEHMMGTGLNDSKVLKNVEDIIALSIKNDCAALLEYFKEIGSDPLGFGEMIRSKHNKYWRSIDWKELYKDTKFEIDIKLNIEFYGAIY